MQVTHKDDHLTSIGVGAKKSTAFQMAQTAEFFMVLSKSLYSNERMAVVREVLCNAWDAHIASGCTDLPVQITLTDEFLIIKDSGPGIAREKIAENYCTYGGGSTKTHDGKQTGGFSLGSKSPFAYADSFEVTSCHAGTKTIYNMVKSSPDNDGLPAADEILSVPTSETGLQVSIPIQEKDKGKFEQYIQHVAGFGEMNVLLNGNLLNTIPFSKCKDGFFLTSHSTETLGRGLHVRYGSVVYPVPHDDCYASEVKHLKSLVQNASKQNSEWANRAMILLAPPNSISVTPSRESLSLSDATKETLLGLLRNVIAKIEAAIEEQRQTAVTALINQCWNPGKFPDLFKTGLLWLSSLRVSSSDHFSAAIGKASSLAKEYLYFQVGKSESLTFRRVRKQMLKALAQSRNTCSPQIRSFLRWISNPHADPHAWLGKEVVTRLQKKLAMEPGMEPGRLHMVMRKYTYEEIKVHRASNQFSVETGHSLQFVRGHIFLSYTKVRVLEAWNRYPAMVHHFGSYENSFAYIVPRRPGEAEKAKAFLTKLGFYVIDMTCLAPGESVETKERAAPKFKPKRQGFVKLSALATEDGFIDYTRLDQAELPTEAKPEVVIRVTDSLRGDQSYIPNYPRITTLIMKWWGDKIAVVETIAHEEKAKAAGAKSLKDFLDGVLPKLVNKKSRVYRHLQIQDTLAKYESRALRKYCGFIHGIAGRDDLLKALGLGVDFTESDWELLQILEAHADSTNLSAKTLIRCIHGFTEHKKARDICDTYEKSTRAKTINWEVFGFHHHGQERAQQELIKFVLKG